MKIAFVVTSRLQTGPNNVVYDLVQLLVSCRFECAVYYFDEEGNLEFPCETHKISMSEKVNFSKYDIVHAHTFRPVLFVFLHKPFRCKTKFVATLHNYVFEDLKYVYGKFKGFIFGLFFLLLLIRQDKLIALSKDAMTYYRNWFPSKKLTFIYNSRITDKKEMLTSEELNDLMQFKKNGVLIGVNCSIHERKGLDILLKALQHLPERFKLYIVGDGPGLESLKELCNQLGLDQRVRFCGRIQKAYKFLPHYDIYAIPSRSEGFPLALLEAADYSCKVVCSDINVFKECFSEEEVVMFSIPDCQDLANAILKAEHNQKIAIMIKQRFDKEYSPQCFCQKHIQVYQDLINISR